MKVREERVLADRRLAKFDSQADLRHSYAAWPSGMLDVQIAPIHPRLRGWLDFQIRTAQSDVQPVVRPGLGVDLGLNLRLFCGYAYMPLIPDGDVAIVHEHRFWTALWWAVALPERLGLVVRSGLEVRAAQAADVVTVRFREMVRLNWWGLDPLMLFLSDEVFLQAATTDWGAPGGFDQNRAMGGFGFRTVSRSRLEVAYMNLWAHRNPDDGMQHTLFVMHATVF
jgi:hypothetical protein